MCGIAGLFLKDAALRPALGSLFAPMLAALSDRGPDSAGFAVYALPLPGCVRLTLRVPEDTLDWVALEGRLRSEVDAETRVEAHSTHAVVTLPEATLTSAMAWLREHAPALVVVGQGERMALYKEVGRPEAVAARFDLAAMAGTHAVGHTRMATESAVTTAGAHPFSTGPDQCLVHNGSLSNHHGVRRDLIRKGRRFATENDSEVAAAYLSDRMAAGRSLGEALDDSLGTLDGFYTFVVGTAEGFGVLRDRIACKPAVLAETDRWVAFGSEYRALADLPGVLGAKVWEPAPATVYFWGRG